MLSQPAPSTLHVRLEALAIGLADRHVPTGVFSALPVVAPLLGRVAGAVSGGKLGALDARELPRSPAELHALVKQVLRQKSPEELKGHIQQLHHATAELLAEYARTVHPATLDPSSPPELAAGGAAAPDASPHQEPATGGSSPHDDAQPAD